LRFWPQKRWKQIIFVIVFILIAAFVAFGTFAGLLMSGIISREIVSEIDVKNADGSKTALCVSAWLQQLSTGRSIRFCRWSRFK
jgi:hypothetical protein